MLESVAIANQVGLQAPTQLLTFAYPRVSDQSIPPYSYNLSQT